MQKQTTFTLNEYKSLYCKQIIGFNEEGRTVKKFNKIMGIDIQGNIVVPKTIFEEIKTFVLQNNGGGTQFLVPAYKKGLGEVLQAKNYVGVIETKNRTIIEILPKINQQEAFSDNDNLNVRKIFMQMLQRLRNSPFKHFNTANLKNTKMHLLEIFINMFLEELTSLVQHGLKSDYIAKEENSPFLKGKLKIKEHLKYNYIHKERFFVSYDEYQQDRIENRIIKSTLQFLYKKSRNNRNQQRIREFLFVFDDISLSKNSKIDFMKVKSNRQMKDYEIVLQWCKLFLNNESFTTFKGNSVAFALLFDMNRVFEDYVAYELKEQYNYLEVRTQAKDHYLLEDPKRFGLKPDIVVNDGKVIIDTKWKVIKDRKDISQSDVYQMYAYATKYAKSKVNKCEVVYLMYPSTNKNPRFTYGFSKSNEELQQKLKIVYFDCETRKFDDMELS